MIKEDDDSVIKISALQSVVAFGEFIIHLLLNNLNLDS